MMETGQTTEGSRGLKHFLHTLLTHRRFPFIAAALAILFTLPSLKAGWLVDDYHHKLLMSDYEGVIKFLESPLDMFNFFDGELEDAGPRIDYGILPWWTYDKVKGAFWRPLASITHWFDYLVWPDSPLLMHAHSVVWYGILAMLVAFLYRRFATVGWAAGLAAILYVVDDARGTTVGWLANRNAILAALFGVLTVIVYDRWRRQGWWTGMVVGPVLLVLSLLSAEAGIATCAYLGAYALCIDRDRFVRRFTALIPYVAVVIVWRVLWTYLGYGVAHIGCYTDPLGEPLRYISMVIKNGPLLLQSAIALPPADICMILSSQAWKVLWWCSFVFLVLAAFLMIPLFKQNRTARFWAVGMLLSVLPICAAFPSDRLLSFVSIGVMGLVAEFIVFVFTKIKGRQRLLLWRVPATLLAILLVFIHLVLSPPMLILRVARPMGPKELVDSLQYMSFDESIENQDLVVVNPPSTFLVTCLPAWAAEGKPLPAHMRILASSQFGPVEVKRIDERTITVRPRGGYLVTVLDRLFRDDQDPFSVGEKIELTGMTVEVTELTDNGRPAEAAFSFSVGLEDASLRWLQYKEGRYVPFHPPAVGQSVELPGFNPFRN
ncbi:MAG: hypothetical protein ACYS32_06110 [Planctomycetota bacterium]|jgi:hypothetical protein